MTAVPRGFDTRSAVRALGRVIRSQAAELKLLRIATQDLTNALHLLRLDVQTRLPQKEVMQYELRSNRSTTVDPGVASGENTHVPPGTGALSGPYWEARFKALYERGQEALEPTYPEHNWLVKPDVGRQAQPPWQGQDLQGQDTGPREG
jgi:hypothetical protein